MTNPRRQTVLHLIVATLLLIISPPAEAQIPDLKVILGKGMPLWPVFAQTSHPIDEGLIGRWRKWARKCAADKDGRYAAFPSKYKDQLEKAGDDEKCDDGDMTSFNGLLCAVGVAEGCDGVREAIRPVDGRWFRSPKRKAFVTEECPKGQAVVDVRAHYCERCVSTFSADMSLGVMLFAVAQKDRESFGAWLQWLDSVRLPVPLCDGAACAQLPWIRYCTDDAPCKRKEALKHLGDRAGGKFVFGIRDKELYIGGCTARPWDAYDFSVSRRALNLSAAAPGVEEYIHTVHSILPVDQRVFGVLSSQFTGTKKGYPLHLDAVRILLRMLINNPSLGQGWDAVIPDPITVGFPFQDGWDLSDPISLNATARNISRRVAGNAFFKLLAEGPTNSVRERILQLCPDPEATEKTKKAEEKRPKTEWMWEIKDDELTEKQTERMQWDCVFIGTLFNKMRVRSWNLDDFLKAFAKRLNPIAITKKGLELAIDAAQSEINELQKRLKSVKRAKRSLDALNREFSTQQKVLQKKEGDLVKEIEPYANAMKPIVSEVVPRSPVPTPLGSPSVEKVEEFVRDRVKKLEETRSKLADFDEKVRDKFIKEKMDAEQKAIHVAEDGLDKAKDKLRKLKAELTAAKREELILAGYKGVMLGQVDRITAPK